MSKDDERALIEGIAALVAQHQAATRYPQSSYGIGALGDFLVRWRDAVNNDLPIACAADVKEGAELQRDHLLREARSEAKRITSIAEAEARDLREKIAREKQMAQSAAWKAHQALASI